MNGLGSALVEASNDKALSEDSFSSKILKSFNKRINSEIAKKIFGSLPLVVIIIGSLIVRIIAAAESQGFVHPDEVFQSIEMVHYRIYGEFGAGQTIPWEYDPTKPFGGARSWFFVFVLVAIYRSAMFVGITDPLDLIFLARLFLSIFSMITVLVAYYFGKEIFNKRIGLLSAFLCGFWWFFPFWSSRTMTDSISTDLVFLSLFLAYKSIKSKYNFKKRFLYSILSGVAIGFAFMFRFPSALMGFPIILFMTWVPLITIIDIYSYLFNAIGRKIAKVFQPIVKRIPILEIIPRYLFRNKVMRKVKNFISINSLKSKEAGQKFRFDPEFFNLLGVSGGFLVGSFFMVFVQGMLDFFTWGSFLHSPINFFRYNIIEGLSAIHGSGPWYTYLLGIFTDYAGYFAPLLIILFIFGFTYKRKIKTKIWILVILIFWFVVFSSLAHKEFRFLMTVLPLSMIMIAAGIDRIASVLRSKRNQNIMISFILIFLGATSLYLANYDFQFMWKWNSGICNAMYWVGQQDDVETVIVFETVWYTGGYAYLDIDVYCFFTRISIFPPSQNMVYNSTLFRQLYAENGTYVVVRDFELYIVQDILLEHNMTLVADVFGNPNAKVFAQLG